MKRISEILETIEEEERQEIVKTYDSCIEAICCEEIDWQSFIVDKASEGVLKEMLIAMEPQYIMMVCDQIKEKKVQDGEVEIIINGKKEEDVQVLSKQSHSNEMVALIEITQGFKRYLKKKIRQ